MMNPRRKNSIDVLGIGAVSVDFFGKVDRWPAAGEKQRMEGFSIQDGGLVGTALVAVARLGGTASFVGDLGFSELAERAVHALEIEGVDTSLVLRTRGHEPSVSLVLTLAGGGQRTIFSSQEGVTCPFPEVWSDPQWYRSPRVLLIDHVSGQAGIEAAKIARKHRVTVIIDAERQTEFIEDALANSDHIVVPRDFASLYTGSTAMERLLEGLRQEPHQTVIVTCGSDGCSGLTQECHFHIPAYTVDVVDTTGCGDVFHGAYALMLARGQSVIESAKFASASAALSATKVGGRSGIPKLREVQRLLAAYDDDSPKFSLSKRFRKRSR
jgi:sugar/nucleoside kinase (ribokinase family)